MGKNYMKGVGDFSKNNYAGRNFYYGIREHAMGAIMNGMAFYGLFKTSGSTFLVFSDYMRASVRVAALSHVPTIYIWTHDSIGVGEDGPPHQPVETVSSFRLIPNVDVMRPGDPTRLLLLTLAPWSVRRARPHSSCRARTCLLLMSTQL